MIAAQLDNYWQWRAARGLPRADDACPYCEFRVQGASSVRICAYSLTATEAQVLRTIVPTLRAHHYTPLYTCAAAAGQLCPQQQRDLHDVKTVVLLGGTAAQLVGGRCDFARQQGKPYRLAGWDGVTFMLTFHPADLQRYPAAWQLWIEDLRKAGCPVVQDA